MATQQITCPQCGSPAPANIVQIIDVDQHPQLKQMLLSGQINTAQCSNCGWSGQVTAPLIYHDSAHDLLINFVPMEMNLPYDEQERMMGQMVRAVLDQIPQEKRRAYLLQPQQMVRWQTFIERVLLTEGITKEMIERQRKQSELLKKLLTADNDVVTYLLDQPENKRLIDDEDFVHMVQSSLQQLSQQGGQTDILVKLSNLQAKLMRETEAGKRIEGQQLAMHKLQMAAKAAGGLTVEMLAEHIVQNQERDDIVDAMVTAAGGLNYEFFSALSQHIDKAAKSGDQAQVDRLTAIRTRLLKVFDDMREAAAKRTQAAREVINQIVNAPDKMAALGQNAGKVDELFMSVLEAELQQARDQGDLARSSTLNEIKQLITDSINAANPPHMQLLMTLLQAESLDQVKAMLDANPELITKELVEGVDVVSAEMPAEAPADLVERLAQVRQLLVERLGD